MGKNQKVMSLKEFMASLEQAAQEQSMMDDFIQESLVKGDTFEVIAKKLGVSVDVVENRQADYLIDNPADVDQIPSKEQYRHYLKKSFEEGKDVPPALLKEHGISPEAPKVTRLTQEGTRLKDLDPELQRNLFGIKKPFTPSAKPTAKKVPKNKKSNPLLPTPEVPSASEVKKASPERVRSYIRQVESLRMKATAAQNAGDLNEARRLKGAADKIEDAVLKVRSLKQSSLKAFDSANPEIPTPLDPIEEARFANPEALPPPRKPIEVPEGFNPEALPPDVPPPGAPAGKQRLSDKLKGLIRRTVGGGEGPRMARVASAPAAVAEVGKKAGFLSKLPRVAKIAGGAGLVLGAVDMLLNPAAEMVSGAGDLMMPDRVDRRLERMISGQEQVQQFQRMKAKRDQKMAELTQRNTLLLAQNAPHLFNQLMAGRSLPRGATVIGGEPRTDLVQEVAMGMTQGRFPPPQEGQLPFGGE